MKKDNATDYLEQEFPKGNKLRGQAMILLALATIDEKNRILELIKKKIEFLMSSRVAIKEIDELEKLSEEIKE